MLIKKLKKQLFKMQDNCTSIEPLTETRCIINLLEQKLKQEPILTFGDAGSLDLNQINLCHFKLAGLAKCTNILNLRH